MSLKKAKYKPNKTEGVKKEKFDQFQYHYMAESSRLDKYLDDFIPTLNFLRPKNKYKLLNTLIVNLIYSETERVGIFRSRSYSLPKRHNPNNIGQDALITVLDALLDHGYIEQELGSFSGGTMTIIKMTDKFSSSLSGYGVLPCWYGFDGVHLIANNDPVVLKSKIDKKVIDYTDSNYTNDVRSFLRLYEAFIEEVSEEIYLDIDIEDYRYDIGYITPPFNIKRTFNWGRFNMGGRISAKWTNLSKELRPFLMLADEATKEIDMVCSSINIMYRKATGKPYQGDGDAYHIKINGEVITRNLVKQYLTIAQNTSPHKTGDAYIKELVRTGKLEEFDELGVSVDELDEAIRAKHTQILDYLFKPATGMKVQWSESELVFLVLKRLTNERIPALSVFDSFIVRESDATYVSQVLDEISDNCMDKYLF